MLLHQSQGRKDVQKRLNIENCPRLLFKTVHISMNIKDTDTNMDFDDITCSHYDFLLALRTCEQERFDKMYGCRHVTIASEDTNCGCCFV